MRNLRHSFRIKSQPRQLLLLGVLVRLLVTPFAVHSDCLHTHWVSSCIAFGGKLPFNMQTLLNVSHAGYMMLVSPVVPLARTLCNGFEGIASSTAATTTWFEIISLPGIYRALFVFKAPYLLFDLACALLVYQLGEDKSQSAWMLTFWWLNPILLFAVYVFGRHETIALFFVLLSLYLIRRKKAAYGIVALGMAIAMRYYAIFLLPVYVISLYPDWKRRGASLLLGLVPWALANGLSWVLLGKPELEGLLRYPNEHYLLPVKLSVAPWDNLYLFPLLYILLILHQLHRPSYGPESLEQYSLVMLALMFATAYVGQSPHYWTWFLPFLAIEMSKDRRLLRLHVAQLVCLAVYGFIGGRATAGYLFGPIAPDFFWSLSSPIEIISRFISPETVISLAHTTFSAVTLWMAYLVFQKISVQRVPLP